MWGNNLNMNGPGQWDGPMQPPQDDKDGPVTWIIAILGIAGMGAFIIYLTPPMLLIAGAVILSWIMYQSSPVMVSEFDLPPGIVHAVLHRLFTLAAIGCVITMLVIYPATWYGMLLALYGLVAAISDIFMRWLVRHERLSEVHDSKLNMHTRNPSHPKEIVILLGVPLSDMQRLLFELVHGGGYMALILYYLSVLFTMFQRS